MNTGIITNVDKIDKEKLNHAKEIITGLQQALPEYIKHGHGPFLAAVYNGPHLISECANTVVLHNCSNQHAEINAIERAQQVMKSYDLAPHNLDLYITAEPCMMCIGAIMWSGIKNVYYGVSSQKVEKITGFDEGFKPDWLNEFKKRGINVYGNIESKLGEEVLKQYVAQNNIIYKPSK